MTEQSRRDIVLVIDNSPDTLNFLTTALRQAGFMALVAIDGDSALSVIERVTPDIILLDAVMPGTDGFETCRRLKHSSNVAHIPVELHDRVERRGACDQGLRGRRRRLRDEATCHRRTFSQGCASIL